MSEKKKPKAFRVSRKASAEYTNRSWCDRCKMRHYRYAKCAQQRKERTQ